MYDARGCVPCWRHGLRRAVWLAALGLARALAAEAQDAPTTLDALHAMTRQAGVIFTGTVVRVERHDADRAQAGVVEIEFAVQHAIRGVSGSNYVLREWVGLWPAGDEPYHAGQRYLMLLHAPGASGLSSPVGGDDGAIPLRGSGTTGEASAGDVDLRWIAARRSRVVAYRSRPVRGTAVRGPAAHLASVTAEDAEAIAPGTTAGAAAIAESASYSTVLKTLRTWEAQDRASR